MSESYVYHKNFGIVEVPNGRMGRTHKMHRTCEFINGKKYERYILLKRFEIKKNNKTVGMEWGVAIKLEGRRWVPEFDVVVYKGRLIPKRKLSN